MKAVGRCNKDFANVACKVCVHCSIKKGKEKIERVDDIKVN